MLSNRTLCTLLFIVVLTMLVACAPPSPVGGNGDDMEQPPVAQACEYTQRTGLSASYNASTGHLVFTGVNSEDIPTQGSRMHTFSLIGKAGSAVILDDPGTVSHVNTPANEFTMRFHLDDRGDVLEKIDSAGSTASDGTAYIINLNKNWKGSLACASVPIRTTNFPAGYCGRYNANEHPTVERNVENEFFGGGTGAMDDPLLITMQLYCEDLFIFWNVNYQAAADADSIIYKTINLTTMGDYRFTWWNLGLTPPTTAHYFTSEILEIDSPTGFTASDPNPSVKDFEDRLTVIQTFSATPAEPFVVPVKYQPDDSVNGTYIGSMGLRIRRAIFDRD